MSIQLRRAYDPPRRGDGYRVLVGRVWPRGVSKQELDLDEWRKEIAPSTRLRKWFGHDPERWTGFQERYFAELDEQRDLVRELAKRARQGRLTLVYGARDPDHNQAVALSAYLRAPRRRAAAASAVGVAVHPDVLGVGEGTGRNHEEPGSSSGPRSALRLGLGAGA